VSWYNLGTINIENWEWQTFPEFDVDARLFRITHRYNDPPVGYLTLCSYFSSGERAVFKRLYPSLTPSLIQAPIPADMRAAGVIARYLQVKPPLRTRWYATSNWQVQIESYDFPANYQGADSDLADLLVELQETQTKIDRLTQRITRLR